MRKRHKKPTNIMFLPTSVVCLLITLANRLDPDLDLEPNFDTPVVLLNFFSKKVYFENNQQTTKKLAKFPSRQRFKRNNTRKEISSGPEVIKLFS